MEFTFTASITEKGYSKKPHPAYIRLRRVERCTLDMLADAIHAGHSYCADFGFENFPVKDHKNSANFRSSSLVSIDFDDCPVSFLEDVVSLSGIQPFLAYETFSHLEEGKGNRYRLVYAFSEPLASLSAYRQAYGWVLGHFEDGKALGADSSAKNAVQLMHGTLPSRKLMRIGNVIEGVTFEDLGDVCVCGVDRSKYMLEIAKFKSEVKERVQIARPCLTEYFNGNDVPSDVKYVSESWMIENGYAVDIAGILWVGRNKGGYRDGQRRRLKLFQVVKGVAQLNKEATALDMLHYAWFLNHTIMAQPLNVGDVVEQAINAYDEARNCCFSEAPEGWRNKRGYRLVPRRSYLGKKRDFVCELDDETLELIDSWYDGTETKAGIDNPCDYVMCTEEEAELNIGGYWFYTIKRQRCKATVTSHGNHLSDFQDFEKIMEGYDGKISRRKVADWLKDNGYGVNNNKLGEWLKLLKSGTNCINSYMGTTTPI